MQNEWERRRGDARRSGEIEISKDAERATGQGLLSERERSFYAGEDEPADPKGFGDITRHRVRQRVERIEADLALLASAGEEELVREVRERL